LRRLDIASQAAGPRRRQWCVSLKLTVDQYW
jgi:hypothetical protein